MISSSRDRIQPGGKPKQSDPFKYAHLPLSRDRRANHPRGHHLTLEGGLSQTGRPAELVARKDGKAISMRTGKTYEPDATQAFKRTLSLDSVDEGATRSMARRKKDAPPMNINKKCTDCDKIFKRPCDLT